MRRHLIALGGDVTDTPALRAHLEGAWTSVWAADSGADRLRDLGLVPSHVVGDFDSLSAEGRVWLEGSRVTWIMARRDKDWTDYELLLQHLQIDKGDEVLVVGALSVRRPDHQMGNLICSRQLCARSVKVCLTDGYTFLYPLRGPAEFCYNWENIRFPKPDLVSVVAASESVQGLRYRGLAYSEPQWPLSFHGRTALCNLPAEGATQCTIALQGGWIDLFLLFTEGEEISVPPGAA